MKFLPRPKGEAIINSLQFFGHFVREEPEATNLADALATNTCSILCRKMMKTSELYELVCTVFCVWERPIFLQRLLYAAITNTLARSAEQSNDQDERF